VTVSSEVLRAHLRDFPRPRVDKFLNRVQVILALSAFANDPSNSERLNGLVAIDTFSKFAPGLDENDNAAVALYLSGLSGHLRQKYGCTVRFTYSRAIAATGSHPPASARCSHAWLRLLAWRTCTSIRTCSVTLPAKCW
jgi:hypothetical protein